MIRKSTEILGDFKSKLERVSKSTASALKYETDNLIEELKNTVINKSINLRNEIIIK